MRLLLTLAFAVTAVGLAANPAAAACNDPAGAPAIAGKVYVGAFALGNTKSDEPYSARMVFKPDCTVTQLLGDGGGLIPKAATWTRQGDVLVIERLEPKAAGGKVVYEGKIGAKGGISGHWGAGDRRTSIFGILPATGEHPCGKPGPGGDLAASTFDGEVIDARGLKAQPYIYFNANCTVKLVGLFTYRGAWRQQGDKVQFKVAGRAWQGTMKGKTVSGTIALMEDASQFTLALSAADLQENAPAPPPVKAGAPGGTFTLTREK